MTIAGEQQVHRRAGHQVEKQAATFRPSRSIRNPLSMLPIMPIAYAIIIAVEIWWDFQ